MTAAAEFIFAETFIGKCPLGGGLPAHARGSLSGAQALTIHPNQRVRLSELSDIKCAGECSIRVRIITLTASGELVR
jgi:hypothetical protein